jgi:hypothetical protein
MGASRASPFLDICNVKRPLVVAAVVRVQFKEVGLRETACAQAAPFPSVTVAAEPATPNPYPEMRIWVPTRAS